MAEGFFQKKTNVWQLWPIRFPQQQNERTDGWRKTAKYLLKPVLRRIFCMFSGRKPAAFVRYRTNRIVPENPNTCSVACVIQSERDSCVCIVLKLLAAVGVCSMKISFSPGWSEGQMFGFGSFKPAFQAVLVCCRSTVLLVPLWLAALILTLGRGSGGQRQMSGF